MEAGIYKRQGIIAAIRMYSRSGIFKLAFALLFSSFFFKTKGSNIPFNINQTSSQQPVGAEDLYRLDKIILHGDSITQVFAIRHLATYNKRMASFLLSLIHLVGVLS